MKTAVVFWSGTGNTEAMAQSVADGAKSAGAEVDIIPCAEFNEDMADNYEAIAFGCPSMGDEQLEEDEFEPMFSSVSPKLKGKKIALFGSYGWGDGEWMRNWQEECGSLGAALTAEPVICNEEPDNEAVSACEALGESLVK